MIEFRHLNNEDAKRYLRLARRAVKDADDVAIKTVAELFATVDILEDRLDVFRQRAEDNNEMVWRLREDMDRLNEKFS